MDWKSEWKKLAVIAGVLLMFFYLPVGTECKEEKHREDAQMTIHEEQVAIVNLNLNVGGPLQLWIKY